MEESLPVVIELAPTSRQGLLVGAEASQWPIPIYTVGPKLGVMIQLLSLLQGHCVGRPWNYLKRLPLGNQHRHSGPTLLHHRGHSSTYRDQRLWEEARPTATYCRGSLSPILVGQVYHSVEEAKGASEKEKNQAFEWEKRLVASYKESEGFQCGLRCFSQVPYVLGYKIIIGCFKVWFP
ncbi:hypothetical protein BHE74_00032743 [Ensete ventricosum]|nr:hypothetical protein GW17_00029673 [Ensete ventricosum]RWW60267.1 hypothetical protein BHE74_00032743 [Ensete ventricosum]RZR88306.1 hypothetical protein BHM03_00015842 [Ensete ventricosum]